MKLSEAEVPIRQALERLAESPLEHRCYTIIESTVTGRFVQFCTPPEPSKFRASLRLRGTEPLIFDGVGVKNLVDYQYIQEFCDAERGTELALETLRKHLPEETELIIIEEALSKEEPS